MGAGLLPPFALIDEVVAAGPHHVTRSGRCSACRHINLQEIDEAIKEVQGCVSPGALGSRVCNGTDSMVSLGAWAKGRSGSPGVNRQLQRALSWQIFGRVGLSQFRMSTGAIPADDPSRYVPLRSPGPTSEGLQVVLTPEPASWLTRLVGVICGELIVPAGQPRLARDVHCLRLCRCAFEPTGQKLGGGSVGSALAARGVAQAPPIRPLGRARRELDTAPVRGRELATFETEIRTRVYDVVFVWCQRGAPLALRDLWFEIASLQWKARGHFAMCMPCSLGVWKAMTRFAQHRGNLFVAVVWDSQMGENGTASAACKHHHHLRNSANRQYNSQHHVNAIQHSQHMVKPIHSLSQSNVKHNAMSTVTMSTQYNNHPTSSDAAHMFSRNRTGIDHCPQSASSLQCQRHHSQVLACSHRQWRLVFASKPWPGCATLDSSSFDTVIGDATIGQWADVVDLCSWSLA